MYARRMSDDALSCPHCHKPRTHPPLPEDTDLGRRVVKFHECDCGAIIRLSTREGWERWYDLDWKLAVGDDEMHPCADRDEFYARMTPS